MTKKLRLVLIAVFAFIACACLFAGCTLKPSLKDVLDDLDSKGAVVAVTYFANDGNFNDKSDKDKTDSDKDGEEGDENSDSQSSSSSNAPKNNNGKVRTIHYKVGSKAICIDSQDNSSFESGSITVAATDSSRYELAGWYVAEVDSNGNPLYEDGTPYEFSYDTQYFDSSKKIKHTGELFDFSTALEKGRHYYLVAEWRKIQTVQVLLAGEASSITVAGKTYNKGDLLNDIAFQSNGMIPKPNNPLTGTVTNATFIEFYSDEDCTQLFEGWPIQFADHKDDDPENPFTIYAKYIEGIWTVVKNAGDVSSMFRNADTYTNQYYILNDIDCNGRAIDAFTGDNGFACTIRGNSCTISNLKVSGSYRGNQLSISFFGAIKSSAKISGLTFENVTQVYTVNANTTINPGIFFAFSSIDEGANIDGVVLSGSMEVTINASNGYVKNLAGGATNNWKFGGYTDDSEYSGGITVTSNSSLTIK
ncbi:MAG: hypothetical protein J1G05_02705 [Clostridiales bacterium]|nr:hypothetical protein [Clostridiales bacterium]